MEVIWIEKLEAKQRQDNFNWEWSPIYEVTVKKLKYKVKGQM